MTTNTSTTPPPHHSPTPVASVSKTKLWAIRAGGMMLALLIIIGMIHAGHKPTKSDDTQSMQAPSVDEQAPQLPLNNQQVQKLTVAMQQLQAISTSQENEEAQKLEKMREVAPVQVYSADGNSINVGGAATTLKTANNNASNNHAVLGGDGTGDTNTQFMSRISQSQAPMVTATHIAHPATTLAQGTMIWATLETRINSDLPGMVRAVTSEDIDAEDGSQVLLPKGSRLIGQYNNAIAQGQNRIFVVWQRAIRPDHIDIQLASPGTDQLGTAGVGADSVDYHFLQQFGTAALLSLIGAGAANVGVSANDQFNSTASYREALANSFSQSAQNALQNTGIIKPTIIKNQGAKISVFVARDLDFYDELQRINADNSF